MGRRKKSDEGLDIETTENDSVVVENDGTETETELQAEATDNAEQAEASEESEAAPIEASVPEEAPAPKPKRQRRSRKKPVVDLTTSEETTTEEAAPAAARAVTTSEPHVKKEDLAVAEVSIQKSMESMVKQWSTVKDISGSVCMNLEEVAKVLQGLQMSQQEAQDDASRKNRHQTALHTKIAVAASSLAIVLSLISLGLAQSARQATVAGINPPAVVTTETGMKEAHESKALARENRGHSVMDVILPKRNANEDKALPKNWVPAARNQKKTSATRK